jgi:ribosome-associated protein
VSRRHGHQDLAGIVVGPGVVIPERELSWQFSRSSGPGGQNVNKVETKVELRFHPEASAAFSEAQRAYLVQRLQGKLTTTGELVVVSDRFRHQLQNRQDAMEKFASLLQEALKRPKKRRATKPSRGAVQRRLTEKKQRSQAKQRRRTAGSDE